jgi:hypothetical protein
MRRSLSCVVLNLSTRPVSALRKMYSSLPDCKGKANGKGSCAQMYYKDKHSGISRFFSLPYQRGL